MIEVQFDSRAVERALGDVARAAANPRPLLKLWGEKLTDSTRQRFGSSIAPDGSAWEPNAMATLLGYAGKYSGSFRKKDGRLSAKGGRRVAGKKPLIGESKALSTTIAYRVVPDGVEIGSPQKYAAIHQFGGKAGRGRKITIPARPFLGLSAADEEMVVRTAEEYLRGIVG